MDSDRLDSDQVDSAAPVSDFRFIIYINKIVFSYSDTVEVPAMRSKY